jgi:hypothetical protein
VYGSTIQLLPLCFISARHDEISIGCLERVNLIALVYKSERIYFFSFAYCTSMRARNATEIPPSACARFTNQVYYDICPSILN